MSLVRFNDGSALNDNITGVMMGSVCGTQSQARNASLAPDSFDHACVPPSPPSTIDEAVQIGNNSLPDGSLVSPDQRISKTWRLRNTGSSTWGGGYKLVFNSGEQMGGPSEITLPTASPGQEVDLSIALTAPKSTGYHTGYWQLRNGQGTFFGPRIWVTINVAGQNPANQIISTFDISPASPSAATRIHLVGRVRYFSEFRAMRFRVGDDIFENTNLKQVGDQLEISADWQTGSLPRGNYAIALEVASKSDPNWDRAERKVLNYSLTGTAAPINRPPDRPLLLSPYNWYLKDAAGSSAPVTLCTNPVTDPDGNPVQYWFDANSASGTISSGWISSTCWTYTFPPNAYSWHVKSGDGSAASEWSADTWNFTVAKGGVYVGDFSGFYQANTNDTHFCIPVTYDGIQAPNVYAWLNEAPDGSENGNWRVLDHYGPSAPPDCTGSNVHGFWIRSPYYQTGTHRLKVTAVKQDSGASQTKTTSYNIGYIAPPYPEVVAPSTISTNGTWWNSRQVVFQWNPTLRAETYTLRASTRQDVWNDPAPVLNQVLSGSSTSYTAAFSRDYNKLYWSVRASNSAGSVDSGTETWFGIDQIMPSCQVNDLADKTYENVFKVSWSGSDNAAGVASYDVQYNDSARGEWQDWITAQPANQPFALFNGQPGHLYHFRCRATDQAGNTNNYGNSSDTSTKLDPQGRPQEPWWNSAYAFKRHLTLLNQMADRGLPAGYPVRLLFNANTVPTAADIYASSSSSPRCNDLRIIYNNTSELDRVIEHCDANEISLWFRTQAPLPAMGEDSAAYQLYFGNPSPSTPPTDRNKVFYPVVDGNTLRQFDMREGAGYTLSDRASEVNASVSTELSWTLDGKFGPAVVVPGDRTPEPRPAIYAGYGPQPSCAFTAEMWLKRTPGHKYGGVLAEQEGGGTWRWIFSIVEDHLVLYVQHTTGSARNYRSLDEETFFTNWHHVAVTYSCSGEVKFYIDGELDSVSNLSGGLEPASSPLRLGNNAANNQRLAGAINGFALTNLVKTDFSYARFAAITNEPQVAAGDVLTPPEAGSPDLEVLELGTRTLPDYDTVVEVTLQNKGTVATQNGFYTDLYLDRIPTGSGDYSGSVRFWINEPIPAGGTVELSTILPAQISMGLAPMAAGAETSGTIYVQADSIGSLQETTEDNNVSYGVEICSTAADSYESDGEPSQAAALQIRAPQTHNFDSPVDRDWLTFDAVQGTTYTFQTGNLGDLADTVLFLYDQDGTSLLTSNDDAPNTRRASRLDWTAPASGTYYLLVQSFYPLTFGCGTSYTLTLTEQAPEPTAMPTLSSTLAQTIEPSKTQGSFTPSPSGAPTGVGITPSTTKRPTQSTTQSPNPTASYPATPSVTSGSTLQPYWLFLPFVSK